MTLTSPIASPPDIDRVARQLRAVLGDRLLTPADQDFGPAGAIWNPAVTRNPAVIARCRDADEVALAVRAARDCGVPLSVRGGGHDWAGRALRDGGLVIDLTGLRQVDVDPTGEVATVGGGVTAGQVLAAARRYDLATATGTVKAVGLPGLTLAGGYGPLTGRHGLALDNLLGADVVLTDGSRVTAGPDGDTELFWALRGGGGNFGVVTGLRYRLHPLSTVLAGMILFPPDQAATVLAGYRDFLTGCPDELTVMTGFLPGGDGPALFLCPTWSGADLTAGERAMATLAALGRPVAVQIGPMAYEDALSMFDAGLVDGNHYLLRTRWIAAMSDQVAAVLATAAGALTSPYSMVAVHHFHGAAARVGVADTAFGLRDDHLMVEIIAAWAPDDDPDPHRAWADGVDRALAPLALPGGYPNLLGPDDTDRVRLAYGANFDRLVAAKRRYDPDGVFASAVPTLGLQP